MKAYPVGSATYSKHPDRYAPGAPRSVGRLSGAWAYENEESGNSTSGVYRPNGRKWVDLTSGMGAVILGHGHPDVALAIARQASKGIAFPLPHRLEEAVAERLLSLLTWERAESVRFGKNGADVTTSAVRLARAVTGKDRVLYLDYHGHHDWCMREPPWNAGVMHQRSVRVTKEMFDVDPRADLGVLRSYIGSINRDVAAIVLEPVPSNAPDAPSVDWAALRALCDQDGILLIVDEMVSGFRAAPGGMAEVAGIEPDIACYGKAMANGMPLSAIVGPWEYMKRYEKDVFFSLTHGGEALSLAAAEATMKVLVEENVCARIAALGNELISVCPIQLRHGYPQRLLFEATKGQLQAMLDRGVLTAGYANLTLAHATDEAARAAIILALDALA